MTDKKSLLQTTYTVFNARDIEGALSVMHPDVDWENGMEGGHIHGRDSVHDYWTQQWSQIDPWVEPRIVRLRKVGK